MGLDITAYSKLKYVGKHEKEPELNEGEPGGLDDYCYYEGHVSAYAYSEFPQSFRGITVIGEKKVGSDSTFIEGGCYEVTDDTQTHAFRAGSYTGYNHWRDDLRRQFNPNTDPAEPFYELIYFADNEGTIGELAAIELLADFRAHADRYVDPYPENGGYGRQKYEDWTRAFELAADGGLVDFH